MKLSGLNSSTLRRVVCPALLLATPCSLAVNNITVSGLFRDKAVLLIDGRQCLVAVGHICPEGVKLISADSKEAVLEYNGIRQTFVLGTEINNSFAAPAARTTVTIAPDSSGLYYINGSINGFQVRFVVDTGATLIAMNRLDAQRIGLDYRMHGVAATTETASGYTKIYQVKLKEVAVGNITVHDVDGAVHDDDAFPSVILLGNSFLGRVNLAREGTLLQIKEK